METWIECAWFKCRKRFEPGRRANQFYRADGRHHGGALYCCNAHRQMAYRFRRDNDSASVTKSPAVTTTHATVTRTSGVIENIAEIQTKNGHARRTYVLPDGYVFSDWRPSWQPHWPQPANDLSIPE
jgi:hypothetical protein